MASALSLQGACGLSKGLSRDRTQTRGVSQGQKLGQVTPSRFGSGYNTTTGGAITSCNSYLR